MTGIILLKCFVKLTNQAKKCYPQTSLLLMLNMLQTLHVQILQRNISGLSMYTSLEGKLTIIIFDSRRSDVNPHSHLVTISDEVVQPANRYYY